MTRTHPGIIYETERRQFLSEKPEMRGSITKVTLTSSSGFAARNLAVYGRKVILG